MNRRQHQLFENLAAMTPTPLSDLTKALLVLSSRRSGSSLFCDTLSRTGQVGLCEEWFNQDYMRAYYDVVKSDRPFFLKEYFRWVVARTIGDTGVFAVHAHINQVLNMKETFNAGLDCMTFDVVVRVARRDKVGQAVSLARALKTGKWRHDETGLLTEVTVDDCMAAYMHTCVEDRAIDKRYAGIIDETFYYEDFSLPGHRDCYDRTLTALGKPGCKQYSSTLQKQRDTVTRDLVKQLKERLQLEDSKILIPDKPPSLGE